MHVLVYMEKKRARYLKMHTSVLLLGINGLSDLHDKQQRACR